MLHHGQLREQALCLWLLISWPCLWPLSPCQSSPAPEGLAGRGRGWRPPAGSDLLLPQPSPAAAQELTLKGSEQFRSEKAHHLFNPQLNLGLELRWVPVSVPFPPHLEYRVLSFWKENSLPSM